MACCKCCCDELWYIDQRVGTKSPCDLSGAGLTFDYFDGEYYYWFFADGPYASVEEAEQASFGPNACDPFSLCAWLEANCGYTECDPNVEIANCTFIGPTCECRNVESSPP